MEYIFFFCFFCSGGTRPWWRVIFSEENNTPSAGCSTQDVDFLSREDVFFYLVLSLAARLFGNAIYYEKDSKLMEVQFVYGLQKKSYWLANFLFFYLGQGLVFVLLGASLIFYI